MSAVRGKTGLIMKKKICHIPIFVPHKGCPHNCVFCNQRHITGQITETTPETAKEIIERHLRTLPGDSYKEIAFFGGSFTAIEKEKQGALLKAAGKYVDDGLVDSLRCSTRPDCIDSETLKMLKHYGMSCIELGVQSSDGEVLRLSERGHTFEDVQSASELIHSAGIKLGVQIMPGLPGDTFEKSVKTAADVISLSPQCARIYPTLIVKDTALWKMYQRGEYKPLDVDGAVEILGEVIPMFVRNEIDVIRVGLQTTDEINSETVIGPYHPAIKELATGRIIRKSAEKIIAANPDTDAVLYCCPSLVSAAVGHKRCNCEYFFEKYGVCLRVAGDESLDERTIRISGTQTDIYSDN